MSALIITKGSSYPTTAISSSPVKSWSPTQTHRGTVPSKPTGSLIAAFDQSPANTHNKNDIGDTRIKMHTLEILGNVV